MLDQGSQGGRRVIRRRSPVQSEQRVCRKQCDGAGGSGALTGMRDEERGWNCCSRGEQIPHRAELGAEEFELYFENLETVLVKKSHLHFGHIILARVWRMGGVKGAMKVCSGNGVRHEGCLMCAEVVGWGHKIEG